MKEPTLGDSGMEIESEKLGYWFLRLNGFLTWVNFVVHPGIGRDQGTDVDILGVRFPFRGEIIEEPMEDHPLFTGVLDRPYFVIAEVKTGSCPLNGPWTREERRIMQQVLAAVGLCPSPDLDSVARALYRTGQASAPGYLVSLLYLGNTRNQSVLEQYPAVPQLTWEEVLRFIHLRFWKYRAKKASHQQWDNTGHQLWNAVESSGSDVERFLRDVRVVPPRRGAMQHET